MAEDKSNLGTSNRMTLARPSSAGSSYLVRRVEEKLSLYRENAEAREALENRVTKFKQRPSTAISTRINYVKQNAAFVSKTLFETNNSTLSDQENHPIGDSHISPPRRPSSASCPGSGGSPTAREEYVKYRERRSSAVSHHHTEVQERRVAQLRSWYDHKVTSANRAKQIQSHLQHEARLKADAETSIKRRECWHVLIALCYRLEAIREKLIENQQRRAVFIREKEAAIKIATWFKQKLIEKRHLYLIESCRKFQKFSSAAIKQYKRRIHRNCALRILDFMQKEVSTTRMMSAVQKLLHYTIIIQRYWRSLLVARAAQTTVLSLQLTKFEGHLLTYNRKKASGNNSSVFVATARKTRPFHEEMKLTLTRLQHSNQKRDYTSALTGSLLRERRVKMDDEEDEMTSSQMLFLNTLTVRLPQAIKDQVILDKREEEVRRFYHRWDRYMAEKTVYKNQKPIDDARLNLLRSAGIVAQSQVEKPLRPKLRVLQSVSGLTSMMENGLRLLVLSNPENATNNVNSKQTMKTQRRRRSSLKCSP